MSITVLWLQNVRCLMITMITNLMAEGNITET